MEQQGLDVVALGELLIDFTDNGPSTQGNPTFECNPGGAPCNVLAMLSKLGHSCSFIGKVGRDMFGTQLRRAAEEAGISMAGLVEDPEIHTTLAFVQTLPGGDRDFSFYRNPGADMALTPEEIPAELLSKARIFHFGSLSLTDEPVRSATRRAVAMAREAGALISFDPNLRPPLWRSQEEAKEQIAWGLGQCDVLKISDNELLFMTGETDFHRGAVCLKERYPNLRLLCVTAGAGGSYCAYGDMWVHVPGFCLGGVIETTGAGDTFCACMLHDILEYGLENRTREDLSRMLAFANGAAYLVTTKKGALRVMPTREQVLSLLASHPLSLTGQAGE